MSTLISTLNYLWNVFAASWAIFIAAGAMVIYQEWILQRQIKRLENARDEYKRGMEKAINTSAQVSCMQQGLRDECDKYFLERNVLIEGVRLVLAKIWGYPILENRTAIDVVNYIEGCHERHRQDVISFQRVAVALRAVSEENASLRKELQSRNVPDGSMVAFPDQKTA